MTRAELQAQLDGLPAGETWHLARVEYSGPIIINKPVVIEGHGATIWATSGPVVSVRSGGVALRNVRVEVTGDNSAGDRVERCALEIGAGEHIDLEKVEVRGTAIGLMGEEGEWAYPRALRLGALADATGRDFVARLGVPVPCRLYADVPDLHIVTPDLALGLNDVHFRVANPPKETWINGQITLFTGSLRRTISVTIHSLPAVRNAAWAHDSRTVVWEPLGWDSEMSSMSNVSAPGPASTRRFRTSVVPIFGLIALAILVTSSQLWGLRSLVLFSGERERWSSAKARDEAEVAGRVRMIAELNTTLDKDRSEAQLARAESEMAKQEIARQTATLVGVKKQLELSRTASSELDERLGEAGRQLRKEVDARQVAETRVAELASQKDKLAHEVADLVERREREQPALAEVEAKLQMNRSLLKVLAGQVTDFEAALSASQGKLGETRQAIVKATGELDGVLGDRAKAQAARDTAQDASASLMKLAEQAKVERQAAQDEVTKLRETIRRLADQTKSAQDAKELAEAEVGRVNAELARIHKSINAKDAELKATQDRIAEAEKRRTSGLAEIELLRQTLEPLQAQLSHARVELSVKRLELKELQKPPEVPATPGSPTSSPNGAAASPPQSQAPRNPITNQPVLPPATSPNPAIAPGAPATVDPRRANPRQ